MYDLLNCSAETPDYSQIHPKGYTAHYVARQWLMLKNKGKKSTLFDFFGVSRPHPPRAPAFRGALTRAHHLAPAARSNRFTLFSTGTAGTRSWRAPGS